MINGPVKPLTYIAKMTVVPTSLVSKRPQSATTSASNSTSTTNTGTFSLQNQLPKLPVPSLEETTTKYLKTVKALVLPEFYQQTEKNVAEFIKPGGDGERLQERLKDRASKHKNWVYEWWNEDAYFAYRVPVVPYVSYFFSYKDQPTTLTHPVKRASAIIQAALEFKFKLDSETLEPDFMRKKPIDMELFKFMFNTCRIPKPFKDSTAMYPTEGNEHIIVTRRNRFYKVPYKVNGRELTSEEIEHQIKLVYGDAELKGTGVNVGVLTSENRDRWVTARENLIAAAPKNMESLEAIQSSAFIVCLDVASPDTAVERTHQYWHGHGKNRFYDKPLEFIVNDNCTAGFLGEHAEMDGTQTLKLNEYICDAIFNGKLERTTGLKFSQMPEEITFELNDTVAKDISDAESHFTSEIAKHEVAVWEFKGYGKNLIKKFKTSPDSYVQMLLQIAYYKMNGCVRPVYESATTRRFHRGRTEVTRSVSVESADLCAKFWDPNVTDSEKVAAFKAAAQAQSAYTADAGEGKGVDRHLYGLKKLIKPGEDLPSFYKDPVYDYSSTWYISTSQISSEYLNGYGWSQVVDEGFGCAYMIRQNEISVNICSKYRGSHKYKEYLGEAATELARLLCGDIPHSNL